MSRNFTVIDADQRTPAWYQARAGRVTGSRAADMLATIKSGEAAARRDYRLQLVTERLTGAPQDDGFVSKEMQRGIDCEPLAFAAYEALTGQMVQRSGFVAHTELLAGCSLDGHVGDFEGIVELKCPKSSTHLGYIKSGKVPAAYLAQITHNLWVTGAEWCDFLSWDDRFCGEIAHLQTFLKRVKRTDVDLKAYELCVRLFLSEVEKELADVKGLVVAA